MAGDALCGNLVIGSNTGSCILNQPIFSHEEK
jgi:hypothetical protein